MRFPRSGLAALTAATALTAALNASAQGPGICPSPPSNGIAYDGSTIGGYRSSSLGSVGQSEGPGAWTPQQRAENFQVPVPSSVTQVCFRGFWLNLGSNLPELPPPPPPDWDIEYFASVDGVPGGALPIASFRVGTTPGVTAVTDNEQATVVHPPVDLVPGVCYWLAISRVQGGADGTGMTWHWIVTTSTAAVADDMMASRPVSGAEPGPWTVFTISPTFASNLVFLLDVPVAGASCGDCNRNGIPDVQEIAASPQLDCFNATAPNQPLGGYGPDGILDSCQCRADFNRDGAVNSQDISTYITEWVLSITSEDLVTDINCDGVVNSVDISAFIERWLASVTGQAPLDGCP